MKTMKKICVGVGIFLTATLSLYAQGASDALRLSEPGILSNAKTLGMGNAYTALSNDFSGAAFNPAGIGLVNDVLFSGGLNYKSLDNKATFFNNLSDYSSSETSLNQFGFVFPLPTAQGSAVLAFGYNRTKDFNKALKFDGFNDGYNSMIQSLLGYNDISYNLYLTDGTGENTPIAGGLNQSGNELQSGDLNAWSFTGAVEVQRNLFIGANFNILSGNFKNAREYYEDDTQNYYGSDVLTDPGNANTADFQTFYLNDIIDQDLSGWNFSLGFLYKTEADVNIGATIKFPKHYKVKENYYVNAYSDFGTGYRYTLDPSINDNYEYNITTPYEFSLGAAYVNDIVTVSGDVTFIDYTQMEFTGGLTSSIISQNNKDIKDIFRSVTNYNAGVGVEIPETGITLRGGFMLYTSPYKDDPSDFDKKYVTAGIGVATNQNFSVNVAYAYGWWKNIGDNYGFNESRTYQDLKSNNLVFSIIYNF